MDFSTWAKHLMRMKKTPIGIEKEGGVRDLRPRREERKHPRYPFDAPLEYSTTAGSPARGGYAGNVSETGLLMYSVDNLQVATESKLLIFYRNEYRLDKFEVFARIVWKDCHYEKEWKGFKYGLQFVRMSEGDRKKLREIIACAVIPETKLWDQRDDRYSRTMEASP